MQEAEVNTWLFDTIEPAHMKYRLFLQNITKWSDAVNPVVYSQREIFYGLAVILFKKKKNRNGINFKTKRLFDIWDDCVLEHPEAH